MDKSGFVENFMKKFSDETFIIQKKARALFYYSIMLASFMLFLLVAFLLFKPDMVLQAGIVIIIAFSGFAVTLVILRTGHYNAAANFITCLLSIAVIAGLLIKINRDAYVGYTTFIYFMMALIVQAILFCKKYIVLIISALFLAADISFFFLARHNLDPLSLKAATVGLIDSGFSLVFSMVAGLSLMWIVQQTIEKAESESQENEKNYNRMQTMFRSASDVSMNLASSSEELRETALSFSDNTQSQASSAEEIMATIEEVSAGVDNVANGAKDQYDSMNSLLAEIRQLVETIVEMGTTIGMALNVTRDITGYATSGEKSLQTMNDSMHKINSSSAEMTNIVGIINDISDRINLLSLNAAIEAARAGDAGRGFAVVADEISKLADQTSMSIKEIESHIKLNNTEITRGVSTVGETVTTISRIIEGVNSINTMFDEISAQMKNQQEMSSRVKSEAGNAMQRSDEMKLATEEQKNAVMEISRSISNVNELTQSNSAGAQVLFDHAKHVNEQAENLKTQMDAVNI